MSAITWGMLSKAQDDPETIEEAIVRLIAAHNDDNESHLAAGQSLQSHKAAEIIDHLAESIVHDKIERGAISYDKFDPANIGGIINYETADRWAFDGYSQSIYLGRLGINGLNSVGAVSRGYLSQVFKDGFIRNDRNWFVNFNFKNISNTNGDTWFGAGHIYEPWDVLEDTFFGFKWTGGTLYAYWVTYDSGLDEYTEYTHSLGALNPYTERNYEISFDLATQILTFKIDTVAVHTEDLTDIDIGSGGLCTFLNKNTSGNWEGMDVGPITYGSRSD